MQGRPTLLRALERSEEILTVLGRHALEQDRRRVPALAFVSEPTRALAERNGETPSTRQAEKERRDAAITESTDVRRALLVLDKIDGFVVRSSSLWWTGAEGLMSSEDWIEVTDAGLAELRRRAADTTAGAAR